VALLCANLERSLAFYQGVLGRCSFILVILRCCVGAASGRVQMISTPALTGLEINPDRPHDKLPYRGAWLWIGPEMIHLMELPNPDPLSGRPEVRRAWMMHERGQPERTICNALAACTICNALAAWHTQHCTSGFV
jgi:hypothetical protein